MKTTYKVIENNISLEGVEYTSYGIEAIKNEGSRNEVLKSVPDIFLDRKNAESLVTLCNSEELSSINLMEVIYDIISEL